MLILQVVGHEKLMTMQIMSCLGSEWSLCILTIQFTGGYHCKRKLHLLKMKLSPLRFLPHLYKYYHWLQWWKNKRIFPSTHSQTKVFLQGSRRKPILYQNVHWDKHFSQNKEHCPEIPLFHNSCKVWTGRNPIQTNKLIIGKHTNQNFV